MDRGQIPEEGEGRLPLGGSRRACFDPALGPAQIFQCGCGEGGILKPVQR